VPSRGHSAVRSRSLHLLLDRGAANPRSPGPLGARADGSQGVRARRHAGIENRHREADLRSRRLRRAPRQLDGDHGSGAGHRLGDPAYRPMRRMGEFVGGSSVASLMFALPSASAQPSASGRLQSTLTEEHAYGEGESTHERPGWGFFVNFRETGPSSAICRRRRLPSAEKRLRPMRRQAVRSPSASYERRPAAQRRGRSRTLSRFLRASARSGFNSSAFS
jgi:hypothetical protein